jgi:spore germination cell wall hydrolase CwlJ-like protein
MLGVIGKGLTWANRFVLGVAGAASLMLLVAMTSQVPPSASVVALPAPQSAAGIDYTRNPILLASASIPAPELWQRDEGAPRIAPEPLFEEAALPAPVKSRPFVATSDGMSLKAAVAQARGLPDGALDKDGMCLAEAVYFESRGQPLMGQMAVAQVILHRVDDKRFAKSVCGVVQERSRGAKGACQFSFVCDARSDVPSQSASWDEAKAVAKVALAGDMPDVTGGKALFFHATHAAPAWRHRMEKTATLGSHLFYRPR